MSINFSTSSPNGFKMIPKIDGIEFLSLGNIPKNADKSYQYLVLRLLSGTSGVRINSRTHRQTIDLTRISCNPQNSSGKSAIKSFLTDFILPSSIERFINKTISNNRVHYKDILGEFSHYFIQTQKGSHTAAFVFLYRILERILFSTPLLYTSTQTDYKSTFKDLKDLFGTDTKGEFGLYKTFLNQGKFIDPVTLEIPYTIQFRSAYGISEKYARLVATQSVSFVSTDISSAKIEIKFRDVSELLKCIRNRFFHTRTGDGQPNISIEKIIDPDEFFSFLNPIFCSYLSIVVVHSIAHDYRRL